MFQLIGRGLGPSQIADELSLSVKTVQSHKTNIRHKLDLKDARAVAMHAVHWVQEGSQAPGLDSAGSPDPDSVQ